MKQFILIFFLLFSFGYSFAQSQGECGVSYEDGLLIREQMFRNRAEVSLQTVRTLQQSRFVIHIPLVIHLVGNSNGQGHVTVQNVLSMVCRLNNDFADQNLRFYIKDSLRFVKDDIIFADAYDSVAIDRMIALKDTTALNIFTNGSAGGGVAGYYSRRGDFVFMLNAYANGNSPTITHELGHFFTLPHTFFGWENINARQLYSSTAAPDSIGNDWRRREVEFVDRNGSLANCYSSADGFCDTDADYISQRAQCPLSGTALDPSGTPISPNTTLYMSYFFDACVNNFTTEQKTAIMSSVVNRNWLFFAAPNTDSLDWSALVHTSPADMSTVLLNNNLRLEWNAEQVGPAQSYIVIIERILFGTPVAVVYNSIVNDTFAEVPANLFLNAASYRWQVMPYSNGFTCAGFSQPTQFNVELASSVESYAKEQVELNLSPNPVKGNSLNVFFKINNPSEISFRIISSDGRLLMKEPFVPTASGEHFRSIDVSSLPSGLYHIQLLGENVIESRTVSIVR
jgi:hypothetical protein